MARTHTIRPNEQDHDDAAADLRREVERLRTAELVARAERADAVIEAATARRSLDRALAEVDALRSLWSTTQARLEAERLARAGDRRRRLDAEVQVAGLEGTLESLRGDIGHVVHEREVARAEVVALRGSLSWRVTAPLRAVTGRVRRRPGS